MLVKCSIGLAFVTFVFLVINPVEASESKCLKLIDLNGVNFNLFGLTDVSFTTTDLLFCSPDAPSQFKCTCPSIYSCHKKPDPWGKNIGSCECCAWYIILIIVVLVILMMVPPAILLTVLCKKKWYLTGDPPALPLIVPRRGAMTRVPTGPSIPPHLFTEFHRHNFSEDEPQRLRRAEG